MRVIFLIVTFALLIMLTGCAQENAYNQAESVVMKNYSSGLYFNPTPSTIAPVTGESASNKTAKVMLPGDTIYEPSLRADSITIAGCLNANPGAPDINVCYETVENISVAEYLSEKLPDIISHVEQIVGPTGKLDLVVANKGNTNYSGVFDNSKRVAVVTSAKDYVMFEAGHELTHAAFYQANGDLYMAWLNEALATLTEIHMGSLRVVHYPTTFNNIALDARPVDGTDYFRSERIGISLFTLGASNNKFPVGPYLSSPDPVKTITGLNMAAFAEVFWNGKYNVVPNDFISQPEQSAGWLYVHIGGCYIPLYGNYYYAPVATESTTIPAYGLMVFQGVTTAPDTLVKLNTK